MSSLDPAEHPRPLLRRPWTSLDGEWDFAGDPDRTARPAAVPYDRRVRVPYAPETPASGTGWTGPLGRAWYRRTLPPAGPGRTVLHLGAVDRVADVWVGGAHVAGHEGGWTPWSVDVTEHLGDGGAELVVRADDDPADLEAPRGKQDWLPDPHGIWYPRTTGIWRTVWLERLGRTAVADVAWDTDPLALEATLRLSLDAPVTGHVVRLRVRAGARLLVDDAYGMAGRTLVRTVRLGDGSPDDRARLVWSPGQPTLLDTEIALIDAEGEVVDEVLGHTALREVRCEDGRFLLNGREQPLRLVLDQGYWPATGATPPGTAALRRDLELVRALGFTGVRMHQKTEDPRWYAEADRLGLLAWVEMPSAYRSGTTSARRLLAEWPDVVLAHRGHPSVVAWVPVNESWGVEELSARPEQRALVRALAATAHALDGSRPVSADDGWEAVGGDLLGLHDYEQDPAALAARYRTAADVDRAVRGRGASGHRLDLGGRGIDGRTVVLSEFGGLSTGGQEGWGYGTATGPDDLVRRCRELWAAVHASEVLAGACWTQLTDTYQETNGLLTGDRVPKADPAALARAVRGQPE